LPDFLLALLLLFLLPAVLLSATFSLVPAASSRGGIMARTAPAAAPAKTLTAVSFNFVPVADDFLAPPALLFLADDALLAGFPAVTLLFLAGDSLLADFLADDFVLAELVADLLLVFFADILFSLPLINSYAPPLQGGTTR
jgi:hypothetical protein